jgi:hypothetical protein
MLNELQRSITVESYSALFLLSSPYHGAQANIGNELC